MLIESRYASAIARMRGEEMSSAGVGEIDIDDYLSYLRESKKVIASFEIDNGFISIRFANNIGIVTHQDDIVCSDEEAVTIKERLWLC